MDVFLLGAGFSKAIDDQMPLTSELATSVINVTRNDDAELFTAINELERDHGLDIEQWASWLGGDVPWLSESDSLRHQALYLRLQQAISDKLIADEEFVANGWPADSAPEPLADLCWWMHDQRAAVVTLNYDTLLERAATLTVQVRVDGRVKPYNLGEQFLYAMPLPTTSSRMAATVGAVEANSFVVLKLHGSVNWLRNPYDDRGIGQTYLNSFRDRDPWREDRQGPGRDVGLAPVMIPPTITKAFNDPFLRLQWQHASRSLRNADRLYIVGCGLRDGDWALRQLLRSELNSNARVHVFDRFEGAADRARTLLDREVGEWVSEEPLPLLVEKLDSRDLR